MPVTRRLAEKIEREFPEDPATICSMLHEVENESFGGDAGERILAAVIIVSRGNVDNFVQALRMMEQDWRDLLMDAELDSEDWPSKVDYFLGCE